MASVGFVTFHNLDLVLVAEFFAHSVVDTVESFARLFRWCKKPSQLSSHQNIALFKNGVRVRPYV